MFTISFWEVFCFAAISFFPYLALLLLPFWDRLRYSLPVTAGIWTLVFLADFGGYLATAGGKNVAVIYVIRMVTMTIFAFVTIREVPGKIILTILILINFFVIINTMGTYFEGLLFPEYTMKYYRWTQTLCTIPVTFIFLSLNTIYTRKVYTPTLRQSSNSHVWNYLWIIPLTFLLVWYTIMFSQPGQDLIAPHDFGTVALMLIISLGGFLMDYVIASMINEQNKREEQERELVVAQLKQRQFQDLNKRVEDARRARHDLRHHLNVALSYLNEGRIDDLKQFLGQYQDTLANDTIPAFCRNFTVNALLTYYKQRNDEREIGYHVSAGIPEKLSVKDNDLCIIFGNLLENASDAALEAKNAGKDSEISVEAIIRGDILMVLISNSYEKKPRVDAAGNFQSTKHSGYGIGIDSVREIAEKYQGHVDIRFDDSRFNAMVLLYLTENRKSTEQAQDR